MPALNSILLLPSESEFLGFLEARLATVGLALSSLEPYLASALETTARRFSTVKSKYYRDSDGRGVLRTAHYSQWILFLYELSRRAYLAGDLALADKLYYLNVGTGACDLFYEVEIPIRSHCDHPLGAVIGRAHFDPESALAFTSGCNIGNNWGRYPRIKGCLLMYPQSAVLGETTISGTVVMSRGSCLQDAGAVSDCIVFGARGERRKPLAREDVMGKFSPFKS